MVEEGEESLAEKAVGCAGLTSDRLLRQTLSSASPRLGMLLNLPRGLEDKKYMPLVV